MHNVKDASPPLGTPSLEDVKSQSKLITTGLKYPVFEWLAWSH